MRVASVRLFGGAADALGSSSAKVSDATDLRELAGKLAAEGDTRFREILEQCSFFIDGEHHRALDTPLPEKCEVDVLPPFAGG